MLDRFKTKAESRNIISALLRLSRDTSTIQATFEHVQLEHNVGVVIGIDTFLHALIVSYRSKRPIRATEEPNAATLRRCSCD